jgi:hypothetical protein
VLNQGVTALLSLLLLAPAVSAQQASGIAGVVEDTSGAVLPGVTVEAASPALIEKVRTAISDDEGRYNIVDLRPGTYTVTFTLPGFSTTRREGIELTSGFTATVNAEMRVGALAETVTVTGASPLVDTQNSRQQKVVSDTLLDTLPTSVKNLVTLVNLTPGLSGAADVGGSAGVFQGNYLPVAFHGKRGNKISIDGLRVQGTNLIGEGLTWAPNLQAQQEVTLETGAATAESTSSGVVINLIPKDGGNAVRGSVSGLYTNDSLQSDNLTDALRARGLRTVSKIYRIWDGGGTFGGPIKKDRLWFFTAHRKWGNRNQLAGLYANKTQGTPFYTPDLSRPGDYGDNYRSHLLRLTWQASPKNRVSVFLEAQDDRWISSGSNAAPEALTAFHFAFPDGMYMATWASPVTNKLLLEAGGGIMPNRWPTYRRPGVSLTDISIFDLGTGFRYNAVTFGGAGYGGPKNTDRYSQRFSASYVTGSHAFKAGVQMEEGIRDFVQETNGQRDYQFLNAVPVGINQFAEPYHTKAIVKAEFGLYAQDQWTINRLTLNLGLRYDYFNAYVPEQHLPAGPWVPARDFAAVYDVPSWKDLNPRLGASYNMFGNGRTALKVSLSRYVVIMATSIADANNPVNTSVNTVNRTWNDTNGNYEPDCDLRSPLANGECGAFSDQNFGKLNITTRYADDVIRGFGTRDYLWDFATEVQHELRPGLSITGGYYRPWFRNFRATDNLAVTPADYDSYCITAPTDPRLPGGGGYPVCGLADVSPAKFGQVNNLVAPAANYGTQTQVSNFFNVTLNSRLGRNTQLGGGVDTGRTVTDTCFIVDSPQQLVNCHVVTPFKALTEVKLFGSYALPAGFVASGSFQNTPGPAILANFAAPNAVIAPSLGRNLAACGTRAVCTATATVPLTVPQTQFEGRRTQFDLRLSKIFKMSPRARLQANFDVYNVFNSSAILGVVGTYGSAWRRPTATLPGRLIEFGGQFTF